MYHFKNKVLMKEKEISTLQMHWPSQVASPSVPAGLQGQGSHTGYCL